MSFPFDIDFARYSRSPATVAVGAAVAATLAAVVALQVRSKVRGEEDDGIPTFGPSTMAGGDIVQWMAEGYRKFRGGVFKVPEFGGWLIMVSGPKLIGEIRELPDEVLSFKEAGFGHLSGDYTLGSWRGESNLMAELSKGRMTRSLATLFPSVYEEMESAFGEEVTSKLDGHEWTPFYIIQPFTRIVCRTSNRLFVGQPLCRNSEYMDLNIRYTYDVVLSSNKIKSYPKILEPIVGRWYSPMPSAKAIMKRLMSDLWKERLDIVKHNTVPEAERPNDFLQWNLEAAEPYEQTLDAVIERLLRLNFTAIHTTGSSFTWALYHLAAENTKYLRPMRQEVIDAVRRHGWSKTAVDKMHKMDSFFRESQRLHGVNAASVTRVAMQDFTLSTGTKVKKGQWVGIPTRATHLDNEMYPRAQEFDGFRFYDEAAIMANLPMNDAKRFVSVDDSFLPFGFGRHMCPGRFWAANEMKAMMAYMVINYDLKMENDGVIPPECWHGFQLTPDWSARVMLRKRDPEV